NHVGECIPVSNWYSNEAVPSLACLVVTRITPLAAREPYMDAEAASLRTVTFSISLGAKLDKDPSTPSISINGEEDGSNEPRPLILNAGLSRPGWPEGWVTSRPDILPRNK